MGRRTERYRSHVSSQTGQLQISRAQARRVGSERNYTYQQQNLGSDAQVAGTLGGEDSNISPYTGRYSLNEKAATLFGAGGSKGQELLGDVNNLMQQAEDAARSGDTAAAATFRSQAEQLTYGRGGYQYGLNINSESIHQLFTLNEDPEGKGRTALGAPMAQTVGRLIKQGREFLDPESDTSKRYMRSLTENAERSIASESRGALRAQRDIGLVGGAGRNAMNERAIAARTADTFATARAELHSNAASQFESFSRAFAADSVKLGTDWLQNQGGIRESFQGAMDNLANSAAHQSMKSAQLHQQFSAASGARAARTKAFQRQLIMTGISMVAGAAGGFMAAGAGLMGGASGMGGALIGAGGGLSSGMQAAGRISSAVVNQGGPAPY